MDKLTATRLFQELDLQGLPAVIYPAACPRPTAAALAATFGTHATLMLRTAREQETRNLPRKAGVDAEDAAAWISRRPSDLSVVIQLYDEVIFSVELAIYADRYVVELVPGIWELDTQAPPAVLLLAADCSPVRLEWSARAAPAKFHSLSRGYMMRSAQVEDWQVSALIAWLRQRQPRLAALAERCRVPCGIKLQYAERYGLSPQNLRSTVPALGSYEMEPELLDYAVVSTSSAEVPTGRPIVLDVGIARESGAELVTLVDKLRTAGVDTVYLISGVLSHLAIGLREAGLDVRRFDGRLLRD